jgi:hypothetical protein
MRHVLQLDEEFRYLQRKKNVVKEFTEVRMKVRESIHPPVVSSDVLRRTLCFSPTLPSSE